MDHLCSRLRSFGMCTRLVMATKSGLQNLQSQVNMIISNTKTVVTAISAVNECVTFFQWVRSLWSQWNRTENQEEGDVQKLPSSQDTLHAMYNFTDQAEWRRCEKCVAQVLPELKAAVYDTGHLLEDLRYYEQRVKIEGSATSAEPGIKFFHDFIQGNFSKLIHIQQRLCNQYRLLERMSLHQASPRFDGSVRPETTSFPTETTIVGRDVEIYELIRMLGVPANNSSGPSRLKRKRSAILLSASKQVCGALDDNEATITSVGVLPIVGTGGVGKTNLAQFICHRPQVKEHFDVIVWICVSDDFDVKRLTKEAIKQFSGKTPTEDNLNSLQVDLADSLNKRRFLVVLDDMWAENGELWKTFCAPFKDVLEGSMMLVTTRFPKVADVVHTVDPFILEGLKDDIFHKFLKLCAFGSDSSNNDLLFRPSFSAGTQAATSSHTDVPPMWPLPVSRRQRGQIDSDSSILKVLETVLCMNKNMSNALHREKQARKRDSKRIKRGLRQIKRLRMEVGKGKEVSASGSEAEEEEVESEGEQYPDFDALISQLRLEQQYGQSYALGGGYGYGFGGQFHTGPSSSAALQHHQQFGPQTQFAPSQLQRHPPQTSDDFASTSTVAASIFGGAPPL